MTESGTVYTDMYRIAVILMLSGSENNFAAAFICCVVKILCRRKVCDDPRETVKLAVSHERRYSKFTVISQQIDLISFADSYLLDYSF